MYVSICPSQAAATAAGITCKLVVGLEALSTWSFSPDGRVLDAEGVRVDCVWKTWSWPTVIGLASDADLDYFVGVLDGATSAAPHPCLSTSPGLQHVLLDPRVRVFEPLWTVLPASKAILPVLWDLYPGHPLLLQSSFEWTPALSELGFATKPVYGHCASNVVLHEKGARPPPPTLDTTGVPVAVVFQELCVLPKYGTHFVQVRSPAYPCRLCLLTVS